MKKILTYIGIAFLFSNLYGQNNAGAGTVNITNLSAQKVIVFSTGDSIGATVQRIKFTVSDPAKLNKIFLEVNGSNSQAVETNEYNVYHNSNNTHFITSGKDFSYIENDGVVLLTVKIPKENLNKVPYARLHCSLLTGEIIQAPIIPLK